MRSVESLAQAAELLAQGRVDALVNDNIAVLDYLAASGSTDIKIAGDVEGESTRRRWPSARTTPSCVTRRMPRSPRWPRTAP